MKNKVAISFILLSCLFLVGCGETKTLLNAEYMQEVHVKNSDGSGSVDDLVFEDTNGQLHIFYATEDDMVSLLEEGRKYDVTSYDGDEWHTADAVTSIVPHK